MNLDPSTKNILDFIHDTIQENLNISSSFLELHPITLNHQIRCNLEYLSLLKNHEWINSNFKVHDSALLFEKSASLMDLSLNYLINNKGLYVEYCTLNSNEEIEQQNPKVSFLNQLAMLDTMISLASFKDENLYIDPINHLISFIHNNYSSTLKHPTNKINHYIFYLYKLNGFFEIPWLSSAITKYGAELCSRNDENGLFQFYDFHVLSSYSTILETILALYFCFEITNFYFFQETALKLLKFIKFEYFLTKYTQNPFFDSQNVFFSSIHEFTTFFTLVYYLHNDNNNLLSILQIFQNRNNFMSILKTAEKKDKLILCELFCKIIKTP